MNLSVIICTYNRASHLGQTLESMAALRVAPSLTWELLVIDNNSTDSTLDVARQFQARLPLKYFFERKQGLSAARNRGIQEAEGELLVFTDDDVDVDANWITELCDGADRYPEASFFGGPIQTLWESPPPAWLAQHTSGCLCGLAVYYERKSGSPFLKEGEHSFVGANMMFRKTVFEEGYRFRENLGRKGMDLTGHEDTILMRELLQAGHQGVYLSGARIIHRTGAERMTERYLRKWHIGAGRGVVQLSADGLISPLVLKAPRYLWRKLMVNAFRFGFTRMFCGAKQWVPAECEMALVWGQILEHRAISRRNEGAGGGRK